MFRSLPFEKALTSTLVNSKQNGTSTHAKREQLLEDLKAASKLLLEEAASRNSVSEDSTLVTKFCEQVDNCLRHGLRETAPLFPRDAAVNTTVLLRKLRSKSPEIASWLDELEEKGNGGKRSPHLKASTNNRMKSPLRFAWINSFSSNSLSGPQWVRVALISNMLYTIVLTVVQEGKDWFHPQSIVTHKSDAEILLSLIEGPCALSYVTPTVYDPSWSALPADELLQRCRFIAASTSHHRTLSYYNQTRRRNPLLTTSHNPRLLKANVGTEVSILPTTERPTFCVQSRVSSSPAASTNCGSDDDCFDGVYKPRRHNLLYAKNNVTLGDTHTATGYLAMYGSASGLSIRWTSNELLLYATTLSMVSNDQSNCGVFESDQEIDDMSKNRASSSTELQSIDRKEIAESPNLATSVMNEPSNLRFCNEKDVRLQDKQARKCALNVRRLVHLPSLEIPLSDVDYIHCHRENRGISFVFVAKDGVQCPQLKIPGSPRASVEFLSMLEQGLSPTASLSPTVDSVKDAIFPSHDNESLSTGPQLMHISSPVSPISPQSIKDGKFGRLMNLRILKSSPFRSNSSDTAMDIARQTSKLTNPKNSGSVDGTVVLLALGQGDLEANQDEMVDHTMGANKYSQYFNFVFRIVRNVSLDDREEKSDHLAEAMSKMDTYSPDFVTEKEALSTTVEAIKLKLLSRSFYAWRSVASSLKMLRAQLADVIGCPTQTLEELEDMTHGLTKAVWDKLFGTHLEMERSSIDPRRIYQYVYLGGCSDALRLQVWPYLLQVFDWSMSEDEKESKLKQLSTHYRNMRSQWLEIEHSLTLHASQEISSDLHSACDNCSGVEFNNLEVEMAPEEDTQTDGSDARVQFSRIMEVVHKDVVRCDRNNTLFSNNYSRGSDNLHILRRVVLTYLWEHLEDGYTQGMCDIVAPILALISSGCTDQDIVEETTYIYFHHLLQTYSGKLFTVAYGSSEMDRNFSTLKTLIQATDPELATYFQSTGNFANLYFCYRWFLLNFKREFKYTEIFRVWETEMAAKPLVSQRFEFFVALALIQTYREVIIHAHMEFTDILKFFSERAEKHDVNKILALSRAFVTEVRHLLH
ncbi:unnamed protein product [Dicrocoelium dendriticum]|nr:unnamed protein product [Dicrocoelium dendriticum]CAH8625308.1 unnamed protein product [Dicrocoelium dendriticum]